ncbi:uncharacterized protein LOC127248693 [Andrographis paniculata]|uniref:uncharacterized protein LOC127248693 n=1 Tax=Andrographis paniculata TaxID=175694 RepID=UPI0021E7ADA7|nr:uncharacterized protein LOC127248693 [Andrographis paniculata]
MQCVNKFSLISPSPTSTSDFPNLQSNPTFLRLRIETKKPYHSSEAYDDNQCKIVSKKAVLLPPNVKAITSTSNPFVKHCVKLRQSSSYRHSHSSVLVVGTTPIREIASFDKAQSQRPTIDCLFVLENSQIPEEITKNAARVVHVSSEVISKISGVLSTDSVEVIALLKIPSTFCDIGNSLDQKDFRRLFPFPHRILVLDGIQDPGNLGTLIRSAKAFGWDGVFQLPGCCDPFNDKALRASRGACFQMPIVSGSWTHVETLGQEFQMKMLAGHPATDDCRYPVMRLCKEFADSVAERGVCLVLGSEGGGLSDHSRKVCELVAIPMAGEFESVNVSVAGGIFMYMLQNERCKHV